MAKDGSTDVTEEEKRRTENLPHGSDAPENADTASGGAPDDPDEDEGGE